MSIIMQLQKRVAEWVIKCFGEKVLLDKDERALRFLEEAIETAQALNIPRERAILLVNVVYDKPVGVVRQEVAGSFVTLMALANTLNLDLLTVGDEEVTRVEQLPADYFRKRNEAKAAAGVGNYGKADA